MSLEKTPFFPELAFDVKPSVSVRMPKNFQIKINPSGPIDLTVKTLDGETFLLKIGGVGPVGGDTNINNVQIYMPHFRMLLKMLFSKIFNAPDVEINWNNLINRAGANQRALARKTLDELLNTWVHKYSYLPDGQLCMLEKPVKLLSADIKIEYRRGVKSSDSEIINQEKNIAYRRLTRVTFHPDFWRACLNWQECHNIRADMIAEISSDSAAAVYLALVPKSYADGISKNHKGHIDAIDLMTAIGAKIPKRQALVREFFERVRGKKGESLLQQINGKQTFSGFFFVNEQLELSSSGRLIVRFWSEDDFSVEALAEQEKIQGVCAEYWRSIGLTDVEFKTTRKSGVSKLEDYEISQIKSLGYPLEKDRKFLELIKAFIGPRELALIIGSVRVSLSEGRIKTTIERYLNDALTKTFKGIADRYALQKRKAAAQS